jgi:Uma2 family endonuclease
VVFTSDQRVWVEATGLYTYPDVTVVCAEPIYHPKYRDTLSHPTLVVEILSTSTEAYDRGAKFAHYRRISDLAEYVLISQSHHRVEHHRRLDSGQWVLTEYEKANASVELPVLGCSISLTEIYDKADALLGDDRNDPREQ